MKKDSTKQGTVTMKELGYQLDELRGQPLDLLAREGARLLIQVALEEEVSEFLMRRRYERKEEESEEGYRNGYRKRTIQCGSGAMEIRKPKIKGASDPFSSRILKKWQRISDGIMEVIPTLYVEGLSTRDFKRSLKPLWGSSGLSRSSISRANEALKASFQEWRKRSLADEEILYLFLDGYYVAVGHGRKRKDALLIAHGVRKDGSRELLGVYFGGRESTDTWKGVLHDLAGRGLAKPMLVITDGNAGILRAFKDVWPDVANQRCVAHKIRNVLARVPKSRHDEVERALQKIFQSPCLEEALEAAEDFYNRYRDEFPTATQVLADGLADCLIFYRFPERHWKRIRTSNVLERACREIRRRTRVAERFPTELSAMSMVYGILVEDRLMWRGIHMNDPEREILMNVQKIIQEKPIIISWADEFAA